jgi:hypothetical protein
MALPARSIPRKVFVERFEDKASAFDLDKRYCLGVTLNRFGSVFAQDVHSYIHSDHTP